MSICIKCKREYRISPFYKAREKELEKTPQYKMRKKRYYETDKGKFCKSLEHHVYKTKGTPEELRHDLTFVEWECIVINQGNRCAICGCMFTELIKPERDCIIPLVKGGFLTFDNTQALCDHCNSVKHTSMYSGFGNRWRKAFKNEF